MDFEPGTAPTHHSGVQLTTHAHKLTHCTVKYCIVGFILLSASNVSRITAVFTVYPLVHLDYTLYLFFVAMVTVVDNGEHGKETV